MSLQRDQTELRHFPFSWRADLCSFSLKCTIQNFAFLSWTHLLEASMWGAGSLGRAGAYRSSQLYSGHRDIPGAPRPPEMLSLISETWSFDCLTTCITKPHSAVSWLFPQGLWLFANAWEAKLSGDRQSQPQLHPVLQKSLCHPRLYQRCPSYSWAWCFSCSCQPDIYIYWIICIITQLHPSLQPPQSILCSWSKIQSGRGKKPGRKSQ